MTPGRRRLSLRTEIFPPSSEEEAVEVQYALAREVRLGEQFQHVAGVFVLAEGDQTFVVASVLSTTNWKTVHEQRAKFSLTGKHDPHMLGFREGPAIIEVLLKLAVVPDLILVCGDGITHPRRFGLACHVGLALDHPTIGVSKYWPSGCRQTKVNFQPLQGGGTAKRGTKAVLLHDPSGDHVGFELHTVDTEEPVYVSPGHRVSVEAAASFALRCSPWHRLPEPLRVSEAEARAWRSKDLLGRGA